MILKKEEIHKGLSNVTRLSPSPNYIRERKSPRTARKLVKLGREKEWSLWQEKQLKFMGKDAGKEKKMC